MAAQSYPLPDQLGTIYLLHYSKRTAQGRQHYLGWTSDLERRYNSHRAGFGCRETAKAVAQGCKITVAQTWRGTPALETRLKQWSREGHRGFAGICPFCLLEDVLPAELSAELGVPTLRVRQQRVA